MCKDLRRYESNDDYSKYYLMKYIGIAKSCNAVGKAGTNDITSNGEATGNTLTPIRWLYNMIYISIINQPSFYMIILYAANTYFSRLYTM